MDETRRGSEPDDDGQGFVLEEAEDAFVDGDRTAEVGTIRTALAHRDFRTVFLGMFASNIGSWMQNVIVAAMAYNITKSAFFVSLVGFANLGPQLLLGPEVTSVQPDRNTVGVEVEADVPTVFPGMSFRVHARSQGPVERFVEDAG